MVCFYNAEFCELVRVCTTLTVCSTHSCLKNQAEAPAQPLKQAAGLLLEAPELFPALSHC